MSGESHSYMRPITLGDFRRITSGLPDEYMIEVPSINRCPGEFIGADHVFVDPREAKLSIDGDISEAKARVG